ncbi:SDR family oxidoreductase [Mucilaginibacter ginkgonis]|uniref:SDR family oxidoreductase n=1 Tax=Mucilaginibacter ginkgonis TaxID=2682091 RepID=A0A7T7F8C2_9SPHI|nr:SDR family oxidoreductase [Mucilaginibacter ginkgonis]QQL48676.1 SDR family oxidoreductase [Mucilaginibacter ginkgonis]
MLLLILVENPLKLLMSTVVILSHPFSFVGMFLSGKKQCNAVPPLNKQTIVITGASSGIGRATAIELARYNCKLILAARNKAALDEVADVCNRLGANAMVVVTDVTDAQAITTLGKDACAFGKSIDAWINVAGVGLLGDFSSIPLEVHQQVIQTNLIGYINGAYAALPCFKKQGYGTIVNVNSAGGFLPMPYSVAYTASKYGVRGYAEALQGELGDYPNINVCNVYPGFVDTPGPSHAGNYTGKKLKPMPPVVSPTRVASEIVALLQNPREHVLIGSAAYGARVGSIFAPRFTRWVMTQISRNYFKHAEPEAVTNGNLQHATHLHYQISGGYTSKKVTKHNLKLGGIAGAAAVTAFWLVRKFV